MAAAGRGRVVGASLPPRADARNKADKKIWIVLEGTQNFAQIDKILKEVPFFKNLTRRRQHPC